MLGEIKLKDVMQLVQLLNGNKVINENGRYVIVRTYSAGVFAGELQSRSGQEVILHNARRLWKWAGAAYLFPIMRKSTDQIEYPVNSGMLSLYEE